MHRHQRDGATAPGLIAPGQDQDSKDEGLASTQDQPPKHNDIDPTIFADLDSARKAFVTLQARAALAGFQLHELSGGELLLTRWGLAKSCPDLYSVGRFLAQVTGVR